MRILYFHQRTDKLLIIERDMRNVLYAFLCVIGLGISTHPPWKGMHNPCLILICKPPPKTKMFAYNVPMFIKL